MKASFRRAVIVCCALALTVGLAAPASAHVEKKVGAFHFTVGWGDEPTYAGFKNSVQLILTDARGKAVTDLGDSLKLDVIFSGQTITLPLETTFDPDSGEGTPGDYRGWFIPTRPGTYTFHFSGSIHGQKVDQRFTASDTTFDLVKDPADVQFPAKDPSNGALSDRILADEGHVSTVADDAKKGKDTAGTALILAIVGLAIAVAGTGAGLMRGRSKGKQVA